jgi:predicted MFS family arabinose efflux permease
VSEAQRLLPARKVLGRDFRLLWAAQSVSVLGSSLFVIALPWEAFTLTHATTATAFVAAAQIAPFPVLGVVSGVVADRWDRRRTMIIGDCGRAVVAGILALSIALAVLRLWMLLVGTILLGSFAAIFDAAYAAAVPQVVDTELLNAANGRLEASNAGAGLLGPAMGGILIAAVGAAAVFALDGLSYAVGATGSFLIRYRTPRTIPPAQESSANISRMAKEGIKYISRSPVLRPLTMATAMLAISNGGVDGLLVPLLRGHLHYSELGVGVVFSAGAAGWLVASFLVGQRAVTSQLSRTSLTAILVAAAGGIGVGLGGHLVISAAAMFAFQGGVYYFLITVVTLRQRIVAVEILGRVHAVARSLGNVGTPLGAVIGGILAGGLLPVGPTAALICSAPLVLSAWFVVLALRAAPGGVQSGTSSARL